jgi:hypothetical protein
MGCNRVKAVNKYMAVQGMCVMRIGEINKKMFKNKWLYKIT